MINHSCLPNHCITLVVIIFSFALSTGCRTSLIFHWPLVFFPVRSLLTRVRQVPEFGIRSHWTFFFVHLRVGSSHRKYVGIMINFGKDNWGSQCIRRVCNASLVTGNCINELFIQRRSAHCIQYDLGRSCKTDILNSIHNSLVIGFRTRFTITSRSFVESIMLDRTDNQNGKNWDARLASTSLLSYRFGSHVSSIGFQVSRPWVSVFPNSLPPPRAVVVQCGQHTLSTTLVCQACHKTVGHCRGQLEPICGNSVPCRLWIWL